MVKCPNIKAWEQVKGKDYHASVSHEQYASGQEANSVKATIASQLIDAPITEITIMTIN